MIDTLEMLRLLKENPKRVAKNEEMTCVKDDKGIVATTGRYKQFFNLSNENLAMKWDIVEPEAEKVDFTKAMKAYTKGKQIGSVVSKSKFSIKFEEYIDEVTDEEIDGEWIIED